MAFGIGVNTEQPNEGMIRGKQQEVACDCWFTSSGNTIPRFIKYQDQEGMVHSLYDIEVLSSEKKRYCGIPMMQYQCRAAVDGILYMFVLLFHLEECQWKIVWRQ